MSRWVWLFAMVLPVSPAWGQTSSIGAKARVERAKRPPEIMPRESARVQRNKTYDRYSWITTKAPPPKVFEPGQLITVIVRETRRFEADSELKTKKEFDLTSEIEAFLKLTNSGLGSTGFQRGRPNIDYKASGELKGKADAGREDRMTLRLTGQILDVKPNGNLVIEARGQVQHDEETSVLTVTGTCRREDVTADNTVLSSQLADKVIVVDNAGALRAAATRGWLLKMLDAISPF